LTTACNQCGQTIGHGVRCIGSRADITKKEPDIRYVQEKYYEFTCKKCNLINPIVNESAFSKICNNCGPKKKPKKPKKRFFIFKSK